MNKKNKNTPQAFEIKNRIDWLSWNVKEYYEVGLKLLPEEIKPILKGSFSLKGSYAKMSVSGEMFMYNMYVFSTRYRERKILLHKKQIIKINTFMRTGYVLIPEVIYKVNNLLKLRMALAKHVPKKDKKAKERKLFQAIKEEAKFSSLHKIRV